MNKFILIVLCFCFAIGMEAHPSWGIIVDKNRNIYFADISHNQRGSLWKLHANGTLDTLYHSLDFNQFFGGNATYAPNGKIYFGIKKHKVSNKKLEWNQTIYADEEENIFVPDIGVGNGILVKIDKFGKAETIATNLISRLDRPKDKHNDVLLGTTKGCDGQIYIAEVAGQRIIKILDNGKTQTFYKSTERLVSDRHRFFCRGCLYFRIPQ